MRDSEFYARATRNRLVPLWDFFHEWFTPEPRVRAVGHLWPYEQLRPVLLESAAVVSAAEAERRVLVLENPGLGGCRLVTDSLYAGLQLIVPGESAPVHRHTPAALRFIVEGHGAYTAVNGERAFMEPGDLIITPSWAWHEHGNETSEPTIWLDVLDVATVRFFGATFTERYQEERTRAPTASTGNGSPEAEPFEPGTTATACPPFSYPYGQSRSSLDRLARQGELDPHHGVRIELVDPNHGGPTMPTISTYMQYLPAGFVTRNYRSTAGTVHAVVEGQGEVTIGADGNARKFHYGPRDIWATPSWAPATIRADTDTYVFSASDQAAQVKLGIWRELASG
jgi:gentisate 1,2-dioxygenase